MNAFVLNIGKPVSTHYNLVDSFSLPISLWIGWGGISILYPQIRTVLPESFAIKLKAIVRDESMRNTELSNDILPDKPLDIHTSDVSQRFSFNPFSEIVYADQQILFTSYCFREMTYNIQALLGKRPRAKKRIKNSFRLMNVWRKSLTLITFFNIFLCFLLHARPPVSLSNGSMR